MALIQEEGDVLLHLSPSWSDRDKASLHKVAGRTRSRCSVAQNLPTIPQSSGHTFIITQTSRFLFSAPLSVCSFIHSHSPHLANFFLFPLLFSVFIFFPFTFPPSLWESDASYFPPAFWDQAERQAESEQCCLSLGFSSQSV